MRTFRDLFQYDELRRVGTTLTFEQVLVLDPRWGGSWPPIEYVELDLEAGEMRYYDALDRCLRTTPVTFS